MAFGFEHRGQLSGSEPPAYANVVIANSQTISVGDAITVASGAVSVGTSGNRIFGVVAGIVNSDGIDLENANTNTFDGTFTGKTGSSSDTYVASADNVTDKKVQAQVIYDDDALFINDSDGDFTDPTDLWQHYVLVSESQIDESSNSETVGQFQLVKLDPDGDGDASKGIFRLSTPKGLAFEPET